MLTHKALVASKKDWLRFYLDGTDIEAMGAELMNYGSVIFKESYIVKHLDELERLLQLTRAGSKTFAEYANEIHLFVQEEQIDLIRIQVFFENLMKGNLIAKGYVVHRLNKKLNNEQKDHPVPAERLKEAQVKSLGDETIGMKQLLLPSYQAVMNIPKDFGVISEAMREQRNRIHLLSSQNTFFSLQTVVDLRNINSFVDQWLAEVRSVQEADNDENYPNGVVVRGRYLDHVVHPPEVGLIFRASELPPTPDSSI